jgi:tRNA-2-methylthio-N6-dimethylallyladenosine synthase
LKFFVETFGCQMNVADSQEMGRHLVARGFSPTTDVQEADCVLVNTCTVREHAEHKALSYLGRLADWHEADRRRIVVVAGCAAERLGEKISRRFPHVSLVVGAKSIDRFEELLEKEHPHLAFDGAREDRDAWSGETSITSLLPSETATAYVTIMRGCNYACSYCVVPSVRGREIYRPAKSILSEIRQKAALGLQEVMLLGQTVNSYRPDGGNVRDFGGLLTAVNAVPGVRRIRFMSPHPFYLNEEFARTMAACENVCRHMHLPSQSGSDAVLKRMRRNYTRAEYVEKAGFLRRHVPGIAVTTDFIVGFPGETEADFQETLSLLVEADFDAAYVFK